jgi:hypothetical protein
MQKTRSIPQPQLIHLQFWIVFEDITVPYPSQPNPASGGIKAAYPRKSSVEWLQSILRRSNSCG